LTGTIPFSLGELRNLQTLVLKNNKLNGIIPSNLANLAKLTTLDMSTNHLSGELQFILNSILPRNLYMQNNYFVGSLDDVLFPSNYSCNLENNCFSSSRSDCKISSIRSDESVPALKPTSVSSTINVIQMQ